MVNVVKSLNLPQSAQDFLVMLWDIIQFFDDVIDRDSEIESQNRNREKGILLDVLIRLPLNSFYITHQASLIPAMANALMVWNASDLMERSGSANERSFVWRSSYYQVVLQVYAIVHGIEVAMAHSANILNLYGEDYEAYKTEFQIP